MAVVIRYNPKGLTLEQSERAGRLFMEKGMEMGQSGPPDDLMVHVRFGDDGDLMISEIWSSEEVWREHYESFMKPILAEAGIETAPDVFEVRNVWGSGVPAPPSAQPA
jgi:hypothetical protein